MSIVCRLGGFHLLMSFLGSIGSLMSGSGLEEVLEQLYATNVIVHIISGKAFARAVRGHLIVHAALQKMIMEELMEKGSVHLSDLKKLASINSNNEVEDVSIIVEKVENAIKNWKKEMTEFRTANYWYQYVQYVSLENTFIRAERTGDWHLHLSSVKKMLNMFAATGHIHYAKSARLYLQQMLELPVKYPSVYDAFVNKGYHSI